VTYEDALRNADSINDLRLRIKLKGKDSHTTDLMSEVADMKIEEDDTDTTHQMR